MSSGHPYRLVVRFKAGQPDASSLEELVVRARNGTRQQIMLEALNIGAKVLLADEARIHAMGIMLLPKNPLALGMPSSPVAAKAPLPQAQAVPPPANTDARFAEAALARSAIAAIGTESFDAPPKDADGAGGLNSNSAPPASSSRDAPAMAAPIAPSAPSVELSASTAAGYSNRSFGYVPAIQSLLSKFDPD